MSEANHFVSIHTTDWNTDPIDINNVHAHLTLLQLPTETSRQNVSHSLVNHEATTTHEAKKTNNGHEQY